MLVSAQVNLTATAHELAQLIWVLLAFGLWGAAGIWIYNVWAHSDAKTKVDEATGETITVEGAGTGASSWCASAAPARR